MKRIALILLAATLGLSLPASASAQRVRDLVDEVVKAQQQRQQQQQPQQPSRGGSKSGNDNRGGENRDNRGRGPDNRGNEPRGNDPRGGNDNRGGGDPRNRAPQPGESWRSAPPASPTGREISMSQAIRIVEQSAGPGHHLDGSREDRGGRSIYRIQWATDRGERRDYYVDAQTGSIVGGR